MDYKIVHIAPDEKFINSAYDQFEAILPDQNLFLILVNQTAVTPLNYVSLKKNMRIESASIKNAKVIAKKLQSVRYVVFHSFSYQASIIANRLPKETIIIWLLFGYEIYNNPLIINPSKLYGDLTIKLNDNKDSLWKQLLRIPYFRIFKGTRSPNNECLFAMRRTSFIGLPYKEEYEFIKKKIDNAKLSFFKFSYYPIEKMLADSQSTVTGNSVLLGNSAFIANNHLEILDKLKDFDLKDQQVICPLSYGDNDYAQLIKEQGEKYLGSAFEPLLDFMPLHKYNSYIQSCGFAVMNHYRQQAVGNVLVMLWMGAKVFLNERNTLFDYLKRLGLFVYSINKDLNSDQLSTLLTPLQREHNRRLLSLEVKDEILKNELQSFFNLTGIK
ncbi:TDP-N-acetylfucosamine:lipid II N-acetylfucosaminyltransferase [Leeuwenhoekiella sp. H156]|uniref:TDP-N-acetylfucosamine:lipid II N-acetylfucosaminyltransferase n=1 Tax=Leeuwenhoekiella sp. H156 TaxID=3450128 RepID=UPI003FA4B978